MKRLFSLIITIILIISSVISVYAQDNATVTADRYAEAVDMYLPEINVYVSGVSNDSVSVKASLDGENLKYNGATAYNPDSTSTCIYILADISGSVSAATYDAIKNCTKAFIKDLGSAQSVKYYTFSQDVEQILDGTESYDEAAAKIDKTSTTGNGYTALYDALYLIHEEAVKDKDFYDRQFLILFTDGVDEDNKAKRTFDETRNLLKSHELPVYSMCLDYADSNAKDKLGEISRISGGTNYIFNVSQINPVFNELVSKAFSCMMLSFEKSNNKAGDKDKNLSISIDDVVLPVVTVYESAVRIKDDTTNPTFTVEYLAEEKCIEIVYSENVLGADKTDSYVITDEDGKAVSVESVSYDDARCTARLYFTGRFYTDIYTFNLSGITDDSAAANKPSELTIKIEAQNTALKILDHWWILLIPFFIIIIILLVLIAVKRKRKVTTVKELFEVENENNYEVRHHIVNGVKGREIYLEIMTNNVRSEIKTRIVSSLIFGRSDTCEICIDDVKLSRQHFAFETQGNGELTVTDLGSTNGTYLNGNRITGTMMLRNGDIIAAGLTKIKVGF
ncbi:MAG: FHA domain-containing protein [Clostridia bacterium]|nr:FHA domain-containing protein [Clostridia bacterium]